MPPQLTGTILIKITHIARASILIQVSMITVAPAPAYFLVHFISQRKDLANPNGKIQVIFSKCVEKFRSNHVCAQKEGNQII